MPEGGSEILGEEQTTSRSLPVAAAVVRLAVGYFAAATWTRGAEKKIPRGPATCPLDIAHAPSPSHRVRARPEGGGEILGEEQTTSRSLPVAAAVVRLAVGYLLAAALPSFPTVSMLVSRGLSRSGLAALCFLTRTRRRPRHSSATSYPSLPSSPNSVGRRAYERPLADEPAAFSKVMPSLARTVAYLGWLAAAAPELAQGVQASFVLTALSSAWRQPLFAAEARSTRLNIYIYIYKDPVWTRASEPTRRPLTSGAGKVSAAPPAVAWQAIMTWGRIGGRVTQSLYRATVSHGNKEQ